MQMQDFYQDLYDQGNGLRRPTSALLASQIPTLILSRFLRGIWATLPSYWALAESFLPYQLVGFCRGSQSVCNVPLVIVCSGSTGTVVLDLLK